MSIKKKDHKHVRVKYCNAYLIARTSLGGMKLARIYRGPVTLGFYENSFICICCIQCNVTDDLCSTCINSTYLVRSTTDMSKWKEIAIGDRL